MDLEESAWSFEKINVKEEREEELEDKSASTGTSYDSKVVSHSSESSDSDSDSDSESNSEVNDDQRLVEKRIKKKKALLKRGDTFKTFEDLEARLKELERVSHYIFYRRSSHGIESKKAKNLKKTFHPRLKYYTITYACDSGGKNFKTQSTGKRKTCTSQKGCKASFVVTATKNGKALEVKEVNLKHNHEYYQAIDNHKPRPKSLSKEDELEISYLLNFTSEKKEIKEYFRRKTGKVISFKDIENVAVKLSKGTNNEMDKVADELKYTYDPLSFDTHSSNLMDSLDKSV